MTLLSRRALFMRAVRTGKDILAEARHAAPDREAAPPAHAGQHTGPHHDLGALAADLPPAFLAMEAQRLGLDPATLDHDALLNAVGQALAAARAGGNGG
ncbi:MAG: hypothetical protein AB7E47_00760 [Desulfovibrionaceae bacterium]